MYSAGFVR